MAASRAASKLMKVSAGVRGSLLDLRRAWQGDES
jgi:hypothetical protein